MSEKDSPDGISRRNVLRGVAASGTATVGVAATSGLGAAEEARRLEEEQRDPETARATFSAHTEELRRELAERDIVGSESVDEFSFEPQFDPEVSISTEATVEGFDVLGDVEGEGPTAHLMISKNTDRYDIGVFVRPSENRSYAVIDDGETGERFLIDPSVDATRLESTDACGGDSYCTVSCCVTYYRKKVYQDCFYEPQFGCQCRTTGSDCTGCDDMWAC